MIIYRGLMSVNAIHQNQYRGIDMVSRFMAELKRDYKATWEAYKDAERSGDNKTMERCASDLVRIADAMEREG